MQNRRHIYTSVYQLDLSGNTCRNAARVKVRTGVGARTDATVARKPVGGKMCDCVALFQHRGTRHHVHQRDAKISDGIKFDTSIRIKSNASYIFLRKWKIKNAK